jgi:hypothetical protein
LHPLTHLNRRLPHPAQEIDITAKSRLSLKSTTQTPASPILELLQLLANLVRATDQTARRDLVSHPRAEGS